MPYKDPHDPRKIAIDCAYLNTERGFVTQMISGKFKPSYGKKEQYFYSEIEEQKRTKPNRIYFHRIALFGPIDELVV